MSLSIVNSPLEGDSKVIKIECLQLKSYHIFITIFTLGLSLLFSYWFEKFEKWVYYNKVNSIDEATHFWIEDADDNLNIVQKLDEYSFVYIMLKYTYNRNLFAFEVQNFKIENILNIKKQYIESDSLIIQQEKVQELQMIYGLCQLELEKQSIFVTFMKEIFHPFFVFQIFSFLVWMIEEYEAYAILILITSFFSMTYNTILVRRNREQLQEMCKQSVMVKAYRKEQDQSKILNINSLDLVPGDIILIDQNIQLPCDCLIINGEAIVNECSLTGEAIPVRKSEIQNEISQLNCLFQGTELLQVSGSLQKFNSKLVALVTKTNFITVKGILIRNMFSPKTNTSQFKIDSYKFVGILSVIAVFGFFLMLSKFQQIMTWDQILLKTCDLITVCISPVIMIALSMGIMVAMQNLKKKNIFCISPSKIIDGGEIETVCFDKTGTLTQNHMKLKQYLSFENNQIKYTNEPGLESLACMAVCHNLILNFDQVQGDDMEIAIYNFSKASFNNGLIQVLDQKYQQVQRFEFLNTLERMSIIAEKEDESQFIYTKGSPEKLKDLLNKIPDNYDKHVKNQAQKGYRLLALAYRKLEKDETIERVSLENNLIFLGFVLLENQLKDDSYYTIHELNKAQIEVKMVTGDNILTAINVAQQCLIIADDQLKYLDLDDNNELIIEKQNLNKDENAFKSTVENYEYMDDKVSSNYGSIKQYESAKNKKKQAAFQSNQQEIENQDFMSKILKQNEITDKYAITGKLFNRLINLDNFQIFANQIKIFARFSPDLKIQVITLLQKNGQKVAMVGDGANDCGALKQANIGLSLSETEASIAAPFTAKDLKVSGILSLIKESRAGLVTAFQIFKFICLYSQIQFSTMLLLYNDWTLLSTFQFVYVDAIVILPLFMTLSLVQTSDTLSIQKPSCNLMSTKNLISVFSQIFLQYSAQFSMLYILKQKIVFDIQEYIDYFLKEKQLIEANIQNMTLFLFSNFLYLFSVIAFSSGRPFKKPFYTNIYFILNLIFLEILNIAITINNTSEFWVKQNIEINNNLIIEILVVSHIFGALFWIVEAFINRNLK